jgi:hypothetical protein
LPLLRRIRFEVHCVSNLGDINGSTRVLNWFLENRPDIMELTSPYMCGSHTDTSNWCIDNYLVSSPSPVNWVLTKVQAIADKNTESINLLDWVVIPPLSVALCHLWSLSRVDDPKYFHKFQVVIDGFSIIVHLTVAKALQLYREFRLQTRISKVSDSIKSLVSNHVSNSIIVNPCKGGTAHKI